MVERGVIRQAASTDQGLIISRSPLITQNLRYRAKYAPWRHDCHGAEPPQGELRRSPCSGRLLVANRENGYHEGFAWAGFSGRFGPVLTRNLQTTACLAPCTRRDEANGAKRTLLVNAHERERHQHTAVAVIGSAGGVFSLVRLPWAHNLTDFPPRRGGLDALRWKSNTRLSVCKHLPMINCPRCRTTMIARSRRQNVFERLLRFAWVRLL
jgi:hypothetical protein